MSSIKFLFYTFLISALIGCGNSVIRTPVPNDMNSVARIPGMPIQVRTWGDVPYPKPWIAEATKRFLANIGQQQSNGRPILLPPAHYLALSGGADNGAFGAGLLVGWTASGQRPQFTYVTGISTGALIAPFAFLGAEWDGILHEIYTQYSTKDIFTLRSVFSIPFSDSATDAAPLEKLLEKYVTQDLLDAVAVEYKKGRHLVIGTTHLDAQRPVLWNMGLIAATPSKNALSLFRDVMMASAAVPAIFPPVYIEVEADGARYDEMHVDGGTMSQLVVFPPGINIRDQSAKLGVERERHLYVIRNARLGPEWEAVEPNLVMIGNRSISTLIKAQGKNDLYKIWEMSKTQMINFNLASIPEDFSAVSSELFDRTYMKSLYEYAYNMAKTNYPWDSIPPEVLGRIK